jgi:linoleoyl-CoA desaturase
MPDPAFRELRAELRRLGFYRRPTGRMLLELVINAAFAAAGLMVFLETSSWLIRACALIVWTAGSIGIGTNTHTSSHYATSNKRWVNQALTFLGYPLYFGLPATYWWHKHVLVHHSAPNVIGVDGDADLSPWFATTIDEVERTAGLRRFYYRHLQGFVFPAAIGFTLLSQQIAGFIYLVRSLRSRGRETVHVIDGSALIAHVALTIVIPMWFFPASNVVLFYLARNILVSYAMFSVFAPAHFLREAVRLRPHAAETDYLLAVTTTTLNFRVGRIGRLLCSGLEYQIEHHLLPDISYVYYPAVARLVEEFCRVHDAPYRSYRWELALWRSLSAIWKPCEVAEDLRLASVTIPEESSGSG